MLENLYLNDSKLFLLLKALSPKEIKHLEWWLSSPLHNNSQEVTNLYRNIIRTHRNLDKPINKLTLLNYTGITQTNDKRDKLSPKEDALLRQVIFKLTSQIQDFLVWQKSKADKPATRRLLMDIFLERQLYKLVSSTLLRSKKEIETSAYRNIDYCENTFKITEMEFYMGIILSNRSSKVDVQQVIKTLRRACISKLLRYYCAAKNVETILKIKYDYPLINPIMAHLEDHPDKNIPIIQMYYTLIRLIDEGEEKYYFELKEYLFNNIAAFDLTEIRQFLGFMLNYCIHKAKEESIHFVQEEHDIYDRGLKIGCWSAGIYFSPHQFINIVLNALKLDKTNWARDFIDNHNEKLSPDTKKDILNYCYALVYFKIKELEEAHKCLTKIKTPEDFIYHLRFKVLLIKIYYELQELNVDNADTHSINYELEAIRHYIVSTRNKKMSESMRQWYNNFVNIFKSILDRHKKLIYEEEVSIKNIDKLKEKLHNTSPIVERPWLEEKIEELMAQVS